jgi:hypothetical protein
MLSLKPNVLHAIGLHKCVDKFIVDLLSRTITAIYDILVQFWNRIAKFLIKIMFFWGVMLCALF